MRRTEALKVLLDWIGSRVTSAPIGEQIKVYEALGNLLPTETERRRATEIAITLSEVAKLQLDFGRQLFTDLQKPKSISDGHHS